MNAQELRELRAQQEQTIQEVLEDLKALRDEIGDGIAMEISAEEVQSLREALQEVVDCLNAFHHALTRSERVVEEIVNWEPMLDHNNNEIQF